eukprot:1160766-Pelagomonas_calceolata.AAC.8
MSAASRASPLSSDVPVPPGVLCQPRHAHLPFPLLHRHAGGNAGGGEGVPPAAELHSESAHSAGGGEGIPPAAKLRSE